MKQHQGEAPLHAKIKNDSMGKFIQHCILNHKVVIKLKSLKVD